MRCAEIDPLQLRAFPAFVSNYFEILPFCQMSQFIRILRCILTSLRLASKSTLEVRVCSRKKPCTSSTIGLGQEAQRLRTT